MKSNKLILPIIGALLAAIIGGVIWALIAVITGYEIGFVAWGIGFLAGYVVSFVARDKVSSTHQVIAVIASLIGILFGKYFIFGYYVTDGVSSIFDSRVVSLFQNNISISFGYMDILFVILAVVTAWQLPGKLANKAAAQSQPTNDVAE